MNYDNMHELRDRLRTRDAGMLLDVAAGKGDFLKFLLKTFQTWEGAAAIDVSAEALNKLKENLNHIPVTLVTGSALSMPFPDHVFDAVSLSNSLHHIEDHAGLFSEMARVCKPGGLIVVNEMINDPGTPMQENHKLYHHLISEMDNQMGHYHREIFNGEELSGIIEGSGLTVTDQFMYVEAVMEDNTRNSVSQMVEALNRKLELLRNSDHYYFYENKVKEVIERLQKEGYHKPTHMAFFLKPGGGEQ